MSNKELNHDVEVTDINFSEKIALTNDGMILEITQMFDGDGEETNDSSKASSCVAEREGVFYAINLTKYNRPTFHG